MRVDVKVNVRLRAAILVFSIILLPSLLAAFAEAQEKGGIDLTTAITKVAKDTIPAIVHVEVTQRTEVINPLFPFEENPAIRRFFNLPRMPRKFKRELRGLGTGMLIDPQGHILTDSHVVSGATKIQVLLADGRQYTAKLIGADPKTDLAVIRISTKEKLPHVKFGNSDTVDVGQWVIAIGHPRGLSQTVTQGIISAKHRRGITDPSTYQDFLQTDAAINPGNSGGPLLTLGGEVIGVNSAIASVSGGFEGIGFAIPSNIAVHIMKALIAHGKVQRGWLGVSVQDVTYDLSRSLGLAQVKGALVAEVVKESPAETAGIQAGDVILSFQGKEVADAGQLRNEVASTPVGRNVSLGLWRKGKRLDVTAKIGSLETATKIIASAVKERLGGEFRSVTENEAEKYALEAPVGAVVVSLKAKSPLKEAGIEPRDIILGINGQTVDNIESFYSIISAVPSGKQTTFLVLDHRSGDMATVQVRLK
ncbi:MAG: Do family serine endopeptidase [Syntrophales bacterium]